MWGRVFWSRVRISEKLLNKDKDKAGVRKEGYNVAKQISLLTIHDARGAESSEDLRDHVDGELAPWELAVDAGISVLARSAQCLLLGVLSFVPLLTLDLWGRWWLCFIRQEGYMRVSRDKMD